MSNLNETIQKLKEKQELIIRLHDEAKPKRDALMKEYEEKKTALEKEYQDKIADAVRDLENEKAKYRAETKAAFGVADGESINILDVVEMIVLVQEMKER